MWIRQRAAAALIALVATIPLGRAAAADEALTLRIIVVGTREEAQRVEARLRAGEDFDTLAKALSIDPSAERGGALGRVAVRTLRSQLRQALEGRTVGDITPPVAVPTGFAVLGVVADAAGATPGAPNPALAAAGGVRYVTGVGGFTEASLAIQQYPARDSRWNQDLQSICEARGQSLANARAAVERERETRMAQAAANRSDAVHFDILAAQLLLYEGRMNEALARLDASYREAQATLPDALDTVRQMLGVAHLHKAEADNGILDTPGDRCLLPMTGKAPLSTQGDILRAISHLSSFLASRPDDLEARWLLNVAYMYAGRYPNGVPESQLVPPDAFESSDQVARFVDVAPAAGLTQVGAAGGVIVDDFDNDGRFEIVASSMASCDGLRFYRRSGPGRFVDEAAARGLSGQLGGLNLLQADYDNDGYLDILVLRGGWEFPQRKSLLKNNRDGTFTDVTEASGLAVPTSTQAAVWLDANQDGFLDLFVGNENRPSQLFRNNRDGTFTDIAGPARLIFVAFTKGVAAGDYDNDGWPDLVVSNQGGPNQLFRNRRDGTFEEVSAAAGTPGPGRGFATWFFDYDNDGWLDLFSANYVTSVDETMRTYLGLAHNAASSKLYRNRGDGTFADVTKEVGLEKVYMPMGANFGDVDNDGFLDIYLGTGDPSYASLVPSVLLRNQSGTAFADVTASSGTGELHKGHGVAFSDLDGDGDEEIVFEVGGATPGDRHAMRLFENPGNGADWLSLKLVGVKTNRGAVGARITVTLRDTAGAARTIHRTVGSGGSFGASPLEQHIGLGRGARAVAVDVWWPTSGTRQHFADVAPNQVLQITEGAGTLVQLRRQPLPLSGPQARTVAGAQ